MSFTNRSLDLRGFSGGIWLEGHGLVPSLFVQLVIITVSYISKILTNLHSHIKVVTRWNDKTRMSGWSERWRHFHVHDDTKVDFTVESVRQIERRGRCVRREYNSNTCWIATLKGYHGVLTFHMLFVLHSVTIKQFVVTMTLHYWYWVAITVM